MRADAATSLDSAAQQLVNDSCHIGNGYQTVTIDIRRLAINGNAAVQQAVYNSRDITDTHHAIGIDVPDKDRAM